MEAITLEKQQEGIVVAVSDGMAKVRTSRHSDCENCGACPGNTAIVLDARNPVQARQGQWVMVEVKDVNMLKAAFIVYLLPLIAVCGGVLAGAGTAFVSQAPEPLWHYAGGGIAAFVLSMAYIRQFDRNARKNQKMQPVITRILS